MKKYLLILSALPLAFSSCQQDEALTDTAANSVFRSGEVCAESSTNLMAGQHHLAGSVIVENDADFLYVTYQATGNWRIKKTHLYVGACSGIPTNGAGNPQIGLFPYKGDHSNPSVSSYTYTIALSSLPACGCVAAHAEVVRLNDAGTVVQSETAWGQGPGIGGASWAMKFDYCIQECEDEVEEGCSLSQGYWFANPFSVWPAGGVTIGGHTYTKAEGVAIWQASNAEGIADSKKGFTQVAAIKLSGATVGATASVWSHVSVVEAWLSTLDKLSPTYLPTGNSAVGNAAGAIGDWIDDNHCEEDEEDPS